MRVNALADLEHVRQLDELLLAAVPGQESQVAAWIVEREIAVQRIVSGNSDIATVEELQERTNRLTDRFLHWRRTSIMELSMVEQHLRFLREQETQSGHSATAARTASISTSVMYG